MANNTEDTKDTTEKRKVRYKYCVVPGCRSSTVSTPRKLFFSMPNNELRERWCALMGRRPPRYKPLSARCNRFCCEDHFDLENDMENYIRWRLMGKDTKKLFLKKGVVPHKFDCQRETTEKQVEEKSHDQLISGNEKAQPQQKSEMPLGQRSKKERKTRVNTKKRKPANEEQQRETREDEKKSEEEKISEQRKKIENISRVQQATEVSSQERELETYTFEIKVEAGDYYELNDGDSVLEEFISQDSQSTAPDNSHFLDVSVKVEELDEELELEVVEEETRENMIEDEPDATGTTEIKPV